MTADRSQAGAVLLIVLLLSAMMSLLAVSLLQTSSASVRSRSAALNLERAERAAASGIEWAAAWIEANGDGAHQQEIGIAQGYGVQVEILTGVTPNVVSQGRCGGVTVILEANITHGVTPPSYAYMSFSGKNDMDHPLVIVGSAYMGHPSDPIDKRSKDPLDITGDLHVVVDPSIDSTLIQQSSGKVRYSEPVIDPPVWNTSVFATLAGVTVHSFAGNTLIRDATLNGVVLVTLSNGEELEIQNATINGAVVVDVPYDPAPPGGGHPQVVITDSSINQGPAVLGNLAILSPSAAVEVIRSTVNGVAYAREASKSDSGDVNGMLVVRDRFKDASGQLKVTRSDAFVPEVPYGLTWPGQPVMKIVMYGRR